MNEITIDVLLEFLYNRFAVTFFLCLIGAGIREAVKITSKKEENIHHKMMDVKRMAMSTIFATFLMCACADYVELQFSIYAIICVLCGMWGLAIVNIAISGKFITNFTKGISKNITNPIIKSVLDSASKELEEEQKEEEKQEESKEKEEENKEEKEK